MTPTLREKKGPPGPTAGGAEPGPEPGLTPGLVPCSEVSLGAEGKDLGVSGLCLSCPSLYSVTITATGRTVSITSPPGVLTYQTPVAGVQCHNWKKENKKALGHESLLLHLETVRHREGKGVSKSEAPEVPKLAQDSASVPLDTPTTSPQRPSLIPLWA